MDIESQNKNIVSVIQLLDSWWGSNLTWDGIVQTIQAVRGKILRVETLDLPPCIQGFCVGLRDYDVIGLRKTLDEQRLQFTQFHEASHLLLRHIPYLSFDDETPTYQEYKTECEKWIEKTRHRSSYTDIAEEAADSLAYKLLERISFPKTSITPGIRHFYIIKRGES